MKLQINDRFTIKSDDKQYILVEKKVSEEGNEREDVIAYYGSIEGILNCVLDRAIKTSQVESLKELKEIVLEYRGCAKEIYKSLKV